jgi:hypothetical protein
VAKGGIKGCLFHLPIVFFLLSLEATQEIHIRQHIVGCYIPLPNIRISERRDANERRDTNERRDANKRRDANRSIDTSIEKAEQ